MENSLKVVRSKTSDARDEELNKLVDWIEEAEESLEENRELAEKCRDYYDGDQWTEDEIATLNERKQPVITINRIKPKVDYLAGLETEFRQDPRAYPRTQKHEKAAEACTDAIRYVCDNVDFDVVASDCFMQLLVEGTESCEVVVVPGKDDYEIKIKQLHWDRRIYDHHSRAKDFSDSKFDGGIVWMDKEDAQERWKDRQDVIEGAISYDAVSDTYDDSPRDWVDAGRKRIKVCYLFWRTPQGWMRGVFTKNGWLEDPELSVYLDEGEPCCPLIAQSAYVDRNGGRYGMVRQLLDIQDEINKRRSKALHMMTTRQTYASKQAAGEDIEKLKRELSKADGHLDFEYGEFGKDFGVLPNTDMIETQFQLLAEAKTEIDAIGVNAAMAGDEGRSMSGRALQTRQKGGALEIAPLLDAHRTWKRRVYRAVWNRIRQFWRAEKWIRVTDDEQNLKWVGLNRQITVADVLRQQGQQIPPMMLQQDPRLQMVVGVENEVAEIDVDIIIDEQPDVVTLQGEQFQQLVELYQANPAGVPFDLIIETSSLRNKDKLLRRLRGGDPNGDPEKVAMLQKIQQLQQGLEQTAQQLAVLKASEQAKMAESKARLVESEARVQEAKIREAGIKEKAASDMFVARLNAKTDMEKAEVQKTQNAADIAKVQMDLAELITQSGVMRQQQTASDALIKELASMVQKLMRASVEDEDIA